MRNLLFVAGGLAALPWAQATATCTGVTFLPTPMAGYTCGGGGTLKKPSIINTIQNTTANACAAACLSISACMSMGFDSCKLRIWLFHVLLHISNSNLTASSTCNIYSHTLVHQAFVPSNTTMHYWNPHCFECAAVSSSTTITKAASTKATTTKAATTTATGTSKPTVTKAPGAAATCTQISAQIPGGTNAYPYIFYARAIGLTETPYNPGNDNSNYGPVSTTLSGNYTTDCSAIQACAQQAIMQSYTYYSFDVHHLTSANAWTCVMYYDPNWQKGNQNFFNVSNSDVSVAYGYYNTKF